MKAPALFASIAAALIAAFALFTNVPHIFAQGPRTLKPAVSRPVKSDVSLPVARLHAVAATPVRIPRLALRKPSNAKANPPRTRDPLLSTITPSSFMAMPMKSFEGTRFYTGTTNIPTGFPPDPNGDIGYDPSSGKRYYVQWVNNSIAFYDVTNTPTLILGPVPGNTLWQGFGGACETTNDGDPTALFDPLAHRWLMSQFSVPNGINSGPYYQCIAISSSADPTGTYYRYQFLMSNDKLNDYAKFGVWPDAYYMSINQFSGGVTFVGGAAVAFERAKMLTGDPTARMVYFDLGLVNHNFGGQLPADFDGTIPPPAGAPGYFAEMDQAGVLLANQAALGVWEFHVNWSNPANSTFGLGGQPNVILPTANFSMLPCETLGWTGCIEQPWIGGTLLDSVADRLMYRLQYRNYGDRESLVANHTVNLAPSSYFGLPGIRWYELAKSAATNWSIRQQGTYGPDSNGRWMGSIASDSQGNIALAYSISSETIYPSIRYVGRLATDPLGSLPRGEVPLFTGSAYQMDEGRWGDYTTLAVDPQDDCTFWYTNEYYQIDSYSWWQTRIGSFRFPSCGGAPPPPAAPSGLSAVTSPTAPRVDLSWTQTNLTGVNGYVVYRDSAYLGTIADPNIKSYTDTTVGVGISYSYTVDAFDGSGFHSALSAPASARTPDSYTLTPVADTYVDAAYPLTNYGTSMDLRVDNSPMMLSYVAFNVQGWRPGAAAALRLFVKSTNSTGFTANYINWGPWQETWVIYNTGLPIDQAIASTGPVTSGTWVTLNVTPIVYFNGWMNVGLRTTSNTAIDIASRESGIYAPQLVLTATGGAGQPQSHQLYLPLLSKPAPVTQP